MLQAAIRKNYNGNVNEVLTQFKLNKSFFLAFIYVYTVHVIATCPTMKDFCSLWQDPFQSQQYISSPCSLQVNWFSARSLQSRRLVSLCSWCGPSLFYFLVFLLTILSLFCFSVLNFVPGLRFHDASVVCLLLFLWNWKLFFFNP